MRWCVTDDGTADTLPTHGDMLQFGQKPTTQVCTHLRCRRWQCIAMGGREEARPCSGGSQPLRKSSARLWGQLGCDGHLHFCEKHTRPSAVLEAMRRRQGQHFARRLWSGPFPGEYPTDPGFGAVWVDMWDAMAREWESGSSRSGPCARVNGPQNGPS